MGIIKALMIEQELSTLMCLDGAPRGIGGCLAHEPPDGAIPASPGLLREAAPQPRAIVE